MKETRPRFLVRKYRSILLAAIVEEMVVYIVSLTDTIVAGNLIGEEALEVVGLASPFLTIALFLAAIVNGGTVRNYSSDSVLFLLLCNKAARFFTSPLHPERLCFSCGFVCRPLFYHRK